MTSHWVALNTDHLRLLPYVLALASVMGGCTSTPSEPVPIEPPNTVYTSHVPHFESELPAPDEYPAEAIRRGLSGNVSLAFSIGNTGEAQQVAVIHSAGRVLDESAAVALKHFRFSVPPDWAASNGPMRRYRCGVTFSLDGIAAMAPDKDDGMRIMVAAARIRRSGSGDVTLAFAGGDGSSVERAVVINAISGLDNSNLEFDWLERHVPGCRVQSRHSFKEGQKHYDSADVKCSDGTKRAYIFDVSESY